MSGLVDLQKALELLLARSDYKFSERVEVRELFSAFHKEYDKQLHPSRKQLQDNHTKIQRLYDLWVSHIEHYDHYPNQPYYFHLARLTQQEKDEFAAILKELLSDASKETEK